MKTTIVLTKKVNQIINWFTLNYENEIGAFGIAKIKNGNIIVTKLLFPNQTVNSVHITIKPEDFKPVIAALKLSELKNLIFYWHKHPNGNATASTIDEKDTFKALMDESTAKRPIMAFLQSAKKNNNNIEYEGLIEIRQPIKATIKDIEVMTEDYSSIESFCKEIIEKHVTKEEIVYKTPAVYNYTNYSGYNRNTKLNDNYPYNYNDCCLEDKNVFNNNKNQNTGDLEPIEIIISNGKYIIVYEPEMQDIIEDIITKLRKFTSFIGHEEIQYSDRKKIIIQYNKKHKKQFKKLINKFANQYTGNFRKNKSTVENTSPSPNVTTNDINPITGKPYYYDY